MIHCYRFGSVTVALDVLTGNGLLAIPPQSANVPDPFHADGIGVLDADLSTAGVYLARVGVEQAEDETGAWCREADLTDGREVFGLYVLDAVHAEADLGDLTDSFAELRRELEATA